MDVLYHDKYRNESAENETGVRYVELDELLRTCDFISVHTPLTPETQHLIGQRELDLMQPMTVLVNSRVVR